MKHELKSVYEYINSITEWYALKTVNNAIVYVSIAGGRRRENKSG